MRTFVIDVGANNGTPAYVLKAPTKSFEDLEEESEPRVTGYWCMAVEEFGKCGIVVRQYM